MYTGRIEEVRQIEPSEPTKMVFILTQILIFSMRTKVINFYHKVVPPTNFVHVVFQNAIESREELVTRTKAENHDLEVMLIMVKFIKLSKS